MRETKKGWIIVLLLIFVTVSACSTGKHVNHAASPDVDDEPIHITIYFDFDSYMLTETAKSKLRGLSDKLQRYRRIMVVLEGHTDSIGSKRYNEILAEKRARAVGSYLLQLGVWIRQLTFVSYGESKLVDFGWGIDAHRRNRRVEIYSY